jgi:aspartyl-tRNA(Asn)/glutamyl-tRNA(Gln) amidotransferase subunit C
MSSKLTAEVVRRVAELAALAVTDDEAEALCAELGSILAHMESLDAVDVTGVEPMFHPLGLATPLRSDDVLPAQDPQTFLAAAPESEASAFAVPKVLDGD